MYYTYKFLILGLLKNVPLVVGLVPKRFDNKDLVENILPILF